MTYRITNQTGMLVTLALPVFLLVVIILSFAFHGTFEAAERDAKNSRVETSSMEKAYMGLNP